MNMSTLQPPKFGPKVTASSRSGMAISSNPIVTRVATDVLRSGGNACDAALTAAIAQTVVEPHMSTITGVLGMLYYDAESGEYSYLNASASAPGEILNGFSSADVLTGRGVAVPGFWAGIEAARNRFGTRSLDTLVASAVELAHGGFDMYPFLFATAFESLGSLGRSEDARRIYFPNGRLIEPGDRVVQHAAGETLERLGVEGSDYFYRGEFADSFVREVARAGGVVSREDLESYEARWQTPARGTYRRDEVIASPPPDQGGSMLIEMLNMLEFEDLASLGPSWCTPETLSLLIRVHNEVVALGAKQRDPNSYPMPLDVLLSKEYAAHRMRLLKMSVPKVPDPVQPGTNHLCVIDSRGNAVSLVHSCMSAPWANGLFTEGVSICAAGSHFLRVMPQPGDRISSIVAPTMIERDGELLLAAGSPSQSLNACILQNVVNILDFDMDLAASVELPRFGGPGPNHKDKWAATPRTMIEVDVEEAAKRRVIRDGVPLADVSPWYHLCGSFEAIERNPTTGLLSSCGDPRRNSVSEGI